MIYQFQLSETQRGEMIYLKLMFARMFGLKINQDQQLQNAKCEMSNDTPQAN